MKFLLVTLLLPFSLSFVAVASETITVFAASSLTESLKEIGDQYETKTGIKVFYNFAASNVLAQQIKAGAPVDVFLSADDERMRELNKAGLIDPKTAINLLGNTLVIVTNLDGPSLTEPSDLANTRFKYIALAEPSSVPAGIYARTYFQSIGIWKSLEGKVVPTENVRAALAAVEAGNADAGVVYRTDAAISKKVKVALHVAKEDGPEIVYPAAVVKSSRNAAAAREFLVYLNSTASDAIFLKFGFLVID